MANVVSVAQTSLGRLITFIMNSTRRRDVLEKMRGLRRGGGPDMRGRGHTRQWRRVWEGMKVKQEFSLRSRRRSSFRFFRAPASLGRANEGEKLPRAKWRKPSPRSLAPGISDLGLFSPCVRKIGSKPAQRRGCLSYKFNFETAATPGLSGPR